MESWDAIDAIDPATIVRELYSFLRCILNGLPLVCGIDQQTALSIVDEDTISPSLPQDVDTVIRRYRSKYLFAVHAIRKKERGHREKRNIQLRR
jgi:hypothetical protein